MRCYYHQEKEAVGSCKSCGKGLCPDCAVDLGKGLACRGRCEEDVRAVTALIERNIKLSPKTEQLIETGRKVRLGGAVFLLLCGLVFTGWSLLSGEGFSFMMILGCCFLVYGGYGILQERKAARRSQQA